MTGSKMEATIIFESHIPNALRRALECAGDQGFVASMPALLHARANADYDNLIWNTWFTANSEKNLVKTPQGNRVVVWSTAAETMNEVAEFLGLGPFEFQSADQLQRSWDAGADNAFEMPQAYPTKVTRSLLADFFEPYNQQLYRLIDQDYGWN